MTADPECVVTIFVAEVRGRSSGCGTRNADCPIGIIGQSAYGLTAKVYKA